MNNHELRCAIINGINMDIISLNETHFIEETNIQIEGYNWYGHNRQELHKRAQRGSGGVGFLIKSWIINEYEIEIVDKCYEGILALKLTSRTTEHTILLLTCYLPPENSPWGRNAQSFFAHILSLIYMYNDCDFMMITGDFNARIGNLQDTLAEIDSIPNRTLIDSVKNQHGIEFIEFLNESRFCVLNGRSTNDDFTSVSTKGKSVVDYFCVPQDLYKHCSDFKVLQIQTIIDDHNLHGFLGHRSRLPDHAVLTLNLTVSSTSFVESDTPLNSFPCTSTRYKLDKIPRDFLSSVIAARALQEVISSIELCRETQSAIDSIYSNFCETLLNEMDSTVPKYSSSRGTSKRFKNNKPYWNEILSTLWTTMVEKEKAFLKCKGSRNERAKKRYDFKNARNTFDKHLRQTERIYRRSIAMDIEDMVTKNPNDFWSKINKLGPRKSTPVPMEVVDENGRISHDQQCVYDTWRSEFSNLYNGDDSGDFDNDHYVWAKSHKTILESNMSDPLYVPNEHLNKTISIEEVSNVIMSAKLHSASGIDNLPYAALKFPPAIAVLQSLFQLIFDTSLIPSIWRKSVIFPLLKDPSSDKRVPLNYRGISLLPCVSKLYSSILNKRIMKHLECNDLLADEQNGFRANRSCEDHIFTLNSLIQNNGNVYTAFIDLKKAFDFVDRDMLLYKLIMKGIDGKMYNSLKSVYASSESCIRLNDRHTDWFQCSKGAKQGDNISPTMFAIFINDLVCEINDLNLGISMGDRRISLLLYADDIVFTASSEKDLQSMLNKLAEWCKKWRVLINYSKSKCMHFRPQRHRITEFQFTIGQTPLEMVNTYKYLGVIFDEHLKYSAHCDAISKGAGRALGGIISKFYNMKEFGFKSYEKLYYNCVVPILNYGASTWGFKSFKCIDNIHNRSMRYYLGVHRFAPVTALIGDTGWLPSIFRQWLSIIRFWNRLLQIDDTRLLKYVFNHDYITCESNWCSHLKAILTKIGLLDFYTNKLIIRMDLAEEKIKHHFIAEWSTSVQQTPKLRTYKLFKDTFICERYIQLNLLKNERSLLAQLRCGILPLRIETGRYIGEPVHSRICLFCNCSEIETETHFVIECAFYRGLRSDIFGDIINKDDFKQLSPEHRLCYLMMNHVRKLSKFIVKAYSFRRRSIYTS